MLKYIPAPLKGLFNYCVISVNTILLGAPILWLALLKAIPTDKVQKFTAKISIWFAEKWIDANNLALQMTQKTEYKISGIKDLKYEGWYTVISNHQSWADIFVLQKVFNHRIPFLKFFLKKDLIWVPLIGLCWWALDFPFMRRYSKVFLEKHPQYKGKDLEITKKSCEKFKFTPVSIMNFLEGTRFQPFKHQQQKSPYKFLLKPKSGGIAYALNVMGDKIKSVVDVTIYYQYIPGKSLSFWNFMSGKVKRVYVHTEVREIPPDLKTGDYENDPVYREKFQNWINQIWREKDQLIEKLQREASVDLMQKV